MKPSDVFGICVRIIGLFGILGGIAYIVSGVCLLFSGKTQYTGFYAGTYLLFGVPFIAIGLYLLRGAPHIVKFAYPKTEATE